MLGIYTKSKLHHVGLLGETLCYVGKTNAVSKTASQFILSHNAC